MTAALSNNGYIFLCLEVDAGWSRSAQDISKGEPDPFSVICDYVRSICTGYKRAVECVAEQYAKSSVDFVTPHLDGHLFQPKFFIPHGNADCLALVLVDDYDAVLHICAHCETIELASLGFCPVLTSLSLEGYEFLVEPHVFWEQSNSEGCNESDSVVTLTKFKLDGLCSLEYALLFKRAIFRGIAMKCQTALSTLQKDEQTFLYGPEDISSARVSMLSMQGQEEIGILIFSRNASINMALSSAIRTLTIPEILSAANDSQTKLLIDLLNQSRDSVPISRNGYRHGDLHRRISMLSGVQAISEADLPVFRWSKSALGFATEQDPALTQPSKSIRGYVAIDFDLHLPPTKNCIAPERITCEDSPRDLPQNCHLALVGTADIRESISNSHKILQASSAVQLICDSVTDAVARNAQQFEPMLVGIRSSFQVPVPTVWPFVPSRPLSQSPLDLLLRQLLKSQHLDGKSIGIDFELLERIPKSYGLPRALRRSIASLFKKFSSAVLNPNLIDLVADLIDAVVSFYQVLVYSLPRVLSNSEGNMSCIEQARTGRLAQYTAALKSAIEQRLELAHPNSPVRNISLQFPGGLTQILNSADAPIKACLGILKYHVRRAGRLGGISPEGLVALHQLGVVTELTLEPGIRTLDLVLGLDNSSESVPPRLSFVQMDLDHLFHVGSHFDHAHEAFHLVFDELFWKSVNPEMALVAKKLSFEDSYTRERLEEVWVHIACFLFFAPSQARSLLYHLVGKYGLDIRSGGPDFMLTIRNFAEHSARLIIVTTLVEHYHMSKDSHGQNMIKFTDVINTFEECIETLMKLFPETGNMSMDDRLLVRSVVEDHLQVFWRESNMEQYLGPLWCVAIQDFYLPLCNDLECLSLPKRNSFDSELRLLESGWSITRHSSVKSQCVDGVAATGILLGNYLTRLGEHQFGEAFLHLERGKDGAVSFRHAVRSAPYLIDRGAAQRFSFDAAARQKRLRHQISILESFSDISSHFRARRILSILTNEL